MIDNLKNNIINMAENLSALMYENNMSSSELAAKIHVTVQTVNRWKRGEQLMMLSKAIEVSNVLHCTLDCLIGRNDSVLNFIPKKCPPFYERLREVMRANGVTRYRLTKETNIKESHLYAWKNGADVKLPTVLELANYFDVTVDYLVGRDR